MKVATIDLTANIKMIKPQGKLCFVTQPPTELSMGIGLLYDCTKRTIYGNYIGSHKNIIDLWAFQKSIVSKAM
jgi:hypothetical protein